MVYMKMIKAILLVFFFQGSLCQRRIKDGEVVDTNKRYVVYLLKARISPQYYDSWLCGGALVSPEYIVTSAACVTDVLHLYAIAGYNKYISDVEINNDPCTKEKKKKIVLTCTPKAYELKYEELEKWSYIDIAVVKVESPYDLTDTSYESVCSYTPEIIQINYETKFQEAGIDAVVLGWGHKEKWRAQEDTNNYNQQELNYAPTLIQDKEECKKQYAVYAGMDEVIDKYMICTFDKGNINIKGETILKSPPTAQGCSSPSQKLRGIEPPSCEGDEEGEEIVLIENTRRDGSNKTVNINIQNKTVNMNKLNYTKTRSFKLNNDIYKNVMESNETSNSSLIDRIYKNVINSRQMPPTRRHGICQNDHGGPLVTWVGAHEVLIGVASVFKINEDYECIGPYLFTSTQCNGAFLDCILSSDTKNNNNRRELCDRPPSEKGYELIENHISWKHHPDGPADNERGDLNKTTTKAATPSNITTTVTPSKDSSVATNITTPVGPRVNTTLNTTATPSAATTVAPTVTTNATPSVPSNVTPIVVTTPTSTVAPTVVTTTTPALVTTATPTASTVAPTVVITATPAVVTIATSTASTVAPTGDSAVVTIATPTASTVASTGDSAGITTAVPTASTIAPTVASTVVTTAMPTTSTIANTVVSTLVTTATPTVSTVAPIVASTDASAVVTRVAANISTTVVSAIVTTNGTNVVPSEASTVAPTVEIIVGITANLTEAATVAETIATTSSSSTNATTKF